MKPRSPCTALDATLRQRGGMVSKTRPSSLLDGLHEIYVERILPIESAFKFDSFYSPLLSETEFKCKPLVLLLGQYSTGKTTFIQSLLGREYPGARVGPEPTTDRFVAVMSGSTDRIIPGNAATIQSDKPFCGLSKFGSSFLTKFQVAELACPLLDSVTLVDTPGVLAGDKQKLGRAYDFPGVVKWFSEHADMILVFFDAHKLDISDELKEVLAALESNEDKVRIILNKADQVSRQELMRVYGALMWCLGRIIEAPEVPRVYTCSFCELAPAIRDRSQLALIDEERGDLVNELKALPFNSATRKINNIVKRARLARVHALLINHLRNKMPAFFGKSAKQSRLIENLAEQFTAVQQTFSIPPGDFPDYELFSERLRAYDISSFPKLSSKQLSALEGALRVDIPSLMTSFPMTLAEFNIPLSKNPFSAPLSASDGQDVDLWSYDRIDHETHCRIFESLQPTGGKLSGTTCKQFFLQSGLSQDAMAKIWEMSDLDNDGKLSLDEFKIMLHLVQLCMNEIAIPERLPPTMLPPPRLDQ